MSETTKQISGWAKARAAVQDRLDGLFEFLGMLIAAAGGYRQVAFAFGLMWVLYGLGLAIEQDFWMHENGHRWMAFGGFILGIVIKLKKN